MSDEIEEQKEAHLGKMVWLAMWRDYKGYDWETFKYCDNASGLTEDELEEIQSLVQELDEEGRISFCKKYSRFKQYP